MKYLKPMELYLESLKRQDPLIGLCVGNKVVEISIFDDEKLAAEPFTTLLTIKQKYGPVADIGRMIYQYSVSGLVIGDPCEKEKCSPITRVEVRHFVDYITKNEKLEDVSYTFWEETFKSSKDMTFVERFAATKTLQEYLDFFNRLTVADGRLSSK